MYKSVLVVILFSYFFAVNALPSYVFNTVTISNDSNSELHELIEQAAQMVLPEPRKARKLLIDALQKVSKGTKIDKYDYLWTQYGLLKSSMKSGSADFGPGTEQEYIAVARNVLKFLDNQSNTGDWQFTKVGAFQMEVYRSAANGLAWHLMEQGKKLSEALKIVRKGKEFSRGDEDYYILDTEVRILLKMGKINDAYKIVKKVLTESPDFSDFQDIKEEKVYKSWLKTFE